MSARVCRTENPADNFMPVGNYQKFHLLCAARERDN
jgi:hypothetical protein